MLFNSTSNQIHDQPLKESRILHILMFIDANAIESYTLNNKENIENKQVIFKYFFTI